MEPVATGVDVDTVMRSVTLDPFFCVEMGCVIGQAVLVPLGFKCRAGSTVEENGGYKSDDISL